MTSQLQAGERAPRLAHDLHVYGAVTVVLDLCLCVENALPVLVVLCWRRPRERSVGDKLLACLSATYVLSALVPTPLGLASYFHGAWFGGTASCECFQVTSTWCSLSALTLVTYLSVDLRLAACGGAGGGMKTGPGVGGGGCGPCPGGGELANVVLLVVFLLTLAIASLPVVGFGPPVMPHNATCGSWLLDTPPDPRGRAYFAVFLAFGFLNVVTGLVSTVSAVLALRAAGRRADRARADPPQYTEERGGGRADPRGADPPLLPPASLNSPAHGYKIAGLVLLNQAMWIPALVIVTLQKVGYGITDASVMYTILSTSLPGLLNPLLLALLYRDYRLGYRFLLRRLCCCCARDTDSPTGLKNLQSTSSHSVHQEDGGETTKEALASGSDATSGDCDRKSTYAYSSRGAVDEETRGDSFLVVEVATERTPLHPPPPPNRPIMASLYDDYGEVCGVPKTELLSPCSSEECLLNADLFRVHSESVV